MLIEFSLNTVKFTCFCGLFLSDSVIHTWPKVNRPSSSCWSDPDEGERRGCSCLPGNGACVVHLHQHGVLGPRAIFSCPICLTSPSLIGCSSVSEGLAVLVTGLGRVLPQSGACTRPPFSLACHPSWLAPDQPHPVRHLASLCWRDLAWPLSGGLGSVFSQPPILPIPKP